MEFKSTNHTLYHYIGTRNKKRMKQRITVSLGVQEMVAKPKFGCRGYADVKTFTAVSGKKIMNKRILAVLFENDQKYFMANR